MKQFFETLEIKTNFQSVIEVTGEIKKFISQSGIHNGIVNISILHTSASLMIQENASIDVLEDLKDFFNHLVPMNNSLYRHTIEGKDDMPAHIKTGLTQTHLTLSIKNQQLILGNWQGIFLFEHRINSHIRKVLLHIIGK